MAMWTVRPRRVIEGWSWWNDSFELVVLFIAVGIWLSSRHPVDANVEEAPDDEAKEDHKKQNHRVSLKMKERTGWSSFRYQRGGGRCDLFA